MSIEHLRTVEGEEACPVGLVLQPGRSSTSGGSFEREKGGSLIVYAFLV